MSNRLAHCLVVAQLLTVFASAAHAQIAVIKRSTNLRPTSSTAHAALRELPAGDTVDLLSLHKRNGYVHVRTRDDSTAGWLYARNVVVDTGTVTVVEPVHPTGPAATPLEVAGTNSFVGCGDHLWR